MTDIKYAVLLSKLKYSFFLKEVDEKMYTLSVISVSIIMRLIFEFFLTSNNIFFILCNNYKV